MSIIPEFYDVEVDGVLVPTKGLKQKIGETAEMEINFVELTEEIIKSSTIGKNGSSEDSSYTLIESKSSLSDGDYYDNIAFVGQMLDGRNIIVILRTHCVPPEWSRKENQKRALLELIRLLVTQILKMIQTSIRCLGRFTIQKWHS